MKSTPEQTAKRSELKRLVEELGELAWKHSPSVGQIGINGLKSATSNPSALDFDEFYTIEHATTAIPAIQTGGKIYLRFRRRVASNGKHRMLWHVWEPGYAATKPAAVDELLPILRQRIASLEGCTAADVAARHAPSERPRQITLDRMSLSEAERDAIRSAMERAHRVNERVLVTNPGSGEIVEAIPEGATFEVRIHGSSRQGKPTELHFVAAENAKDAHAIAIRNLCRERGLTQWRGMLSAHPVRVEKMMER